MGQLVKSFFKMKNSKLNLYLLYKAFDSSHEPGSFRNPRFPHSLRELIWQGFTAFKVRFISSWLLTQVVPAHTAAEIKIQPCKTKLFQSEVEYLRHKISKCGVSMIPEYLQKIKDWPILRVERR